MSGTPRPSIGILDWGIGGTSIYRLLKERRPETPVVYFSDTGAKPYGRMEKTELTARLQTVIGELAQRGVSHLVIGCNAASTALPELRKGGLLIEHVVGVIEPAVRLLAAIRPERASLIGGRRTVVSGVYRRALAEHGIAIRARVAQPLSARIESGDTDSPELEAECRRILAPLQDSSHLLLACTHYPAVARMLAGCVAEGVKLVDPAVAVIEEVLAFPGLPQGDPAEPDLFLTTGDVDAMRQAARSAFGVEMGRVEGVDPVSLRSRLGLDT